MSLKNLCGKTIFAAENNTIHAKDGDSGKEGTSLPHLHTVSDIRMNFVSHQ